MATQRDYYDILGVPRGAADDDIKRSPSNGTPTSTPRPRRIHASRRSTRRTRCCPIRSAARPTTCSATRQLAAQVSTLSAGLRVVPDLVVLATSSTRSLAARQAARGG